MIKRTLILALTCSICFTAIACNNPSPEQGKPAVPTSTTRAPQPAAPRAAAPLPPSGFKVEWISHQIPQEMKAGQEHNVAVAFKNAGNVTWPSRGSGESSANQVLIGYHWLPVTGDKPVVFEGERTWLSRDIAAGESYAENNVRVVAPKEPGSYRLQVSLVQEGVAWFETQGANTVTVPVSVR